MRFAVYRRLGYFPTESSEHLAEYVPWFMHHDDQIGQFRIPVDEYIRRSEENLVEFERVKEALAAGMQLPIERSAEYAAEIIHSIETGVPSVIYGNVRNKGLIANLPDGACVEVPCLVDGAGVQTLVPIMLTHVVDGRLSLERFVDLTSHGVNRVFGLADKGRIAEGFDADFTIVDMKARRTITHDWMATRSGWTPFVGMEVQGLPRATIVRGSVVMRDGELAPAAHGRPVRFQETLGA